MSETPLQLNYILGDANDPADPNEHYVEGDRLYRNGAHVPLPAGSATYADGEMPVLTDIDELNYVMLAGQRLF